MSTPISPVREYDQDGHQSLCVGVHENSNIVVLVKQSQRWVDSQWSDFQRSTSSVGSIRTGDGSLSIERESRQLNEFEAKVRQSMDQLQAFLQINAQGIPRTVSSVNTMESPPPAVVFESPSDSTDASPTSPTSREPLVEESGLEITEDWDNIASVSRQLYPEGESRTYSMVQRGKHCKKSTSFKPSIFKSSHNDDPSRLMSQNFLDNRGTALSNVWDRAFRTLIGLAEILYGEDIYLSGGITSHFTDRKTRSYQGSICFFLSAITHQVQAQGMQNSYHSWGSTLFRAACATLVEVSMLHKFDEVLLASLLLLC